MSIGDHLGADIKKRMYEITKPIKKREVDPVELADRQFRDTERMMGKFDKKLYRGKGGAWK